MKQKQTITLLVILITFFSAGAASTGIFSGSGPGYFQFESIRGETVTIYGKGLYRHMSADVAIQGIAQDYVTLFIGIPLLILGLWGYRKGSIRHHFLLTGVVGYFFVTYLFYMAMAMFNELYLVYVTLMGLTFFALIHLITSAELRSSISSFSSKTPVKFTGGFLIFNAFAIGMMWLGRIVPPLLDGSVYPQGVQHYTTMIVQGFDLGLLLPISFVSGRLLMQKKPVGYLTATPYIVFLAILMTALTAKIIAMGIHGVNIIPAVFIIPAINLTTIGCAWAMLKNV